MIALLKGGIEIPLAKGCACGFGLEPHVERCGIKR